MTDKERIEKMESKPVVFENFVEETITIDGIQFTQIQTKAIHHFLNALQTQNVVEALEKVKKSLIEKFMRVDEGFNFFGFIDYIDQLIKEYGGKR